MSLRNRRDGSDRRGDGVSSFLRYIVAGVAALCAHLIVLTLLVEGFAINKPLASTIGLLCSLPVNYLLQYFYVFRSTGPLFTNFSKYLAVTAVTATVNALLMWLMTERTSIPYQMAQIITTATIFVINYFANRAITFGRGASNLDEAIRETPPVK